MSIVPVPHGPPVQVPVFELAGSQVKVVVQLPAVPLVPQIAGRYHIFLQPGSTGINLGRLSRTTCYYFPANIYIILTKLRHMFLSLYQLKNLYLKHKHAKSS